MQQDSNCDPLIKSERIDPIAATLMIATLPRSLPLLQFQHFGPLQQFDLAVEVGASIDAPMPIPLGLDVGLRLFVTAPRLR